MPTPTQPRTFKFGYRHSPPVALARRRFFHEYATPSLPAPPPELVYYRVHAMPSLVTMQGNDQYGDCVEAAMAHQVGLWTGNANPPCVIPTETETLNFYHAINGNDQDNGTDPIRALNYWQNKGFPISSGTHKIAGWLAINPTNWLHIQQCIWLFGGVLPCLDLPDDYTNPFPSGDAFVWTKVGPPNPQQGHMPGACGYKRNWLVLDTWAMWGLMSPEAVAYYCDWAQGGALYTAISQDWINRGKQISPTGLNWAQLEADFATARVVGEREEAVVAETPRPSLARRMIGGLRFGREGER